jgi:hypothetical protein
MNKKWDSTVWIGNCGKFLYKTKCEQENQVESCASLEKEGGGMHCK